MALTVLKDIRRIYAGLNADEIRGSAYHDLNVGLMAASEEGYQEMEQFLAPLWLDATARAEALRPFIGWTARRATVSILYFAGEGVPVPPTAIGSIRRTPDPSRRRSSPIITTLELAIGPQFPVFRRPAADKIIHRISRENALFSLVTALPNVIPSVIDLPWAVGEFATDTAFLTMNQIRMALLMAGAHGQTVGYTEQKAQIAVIAAGAFGWRALARELVGKIPLGGGLIPKAAVAFAGTYVVGLGLEKVNRTGIGPVGG